ncbi:hypothetical protein [Tahibacter amnicola]|uniref:Transmembrane protein n=1 Tax=Tahibacter amnicola TaxID=2976241 RepID=A0ABY6BCC4_9GAMM|nr:hypothetical protein [Tahibacter amnicola]UXI67514.1 hypothetical protein N4264_22695 [Tahibacter amnicola]
MSNPLPAVKSVAKSRSPASTLLLAATLLATYAYAHTALVAVANFGLRFPYSDHYRIYANFFSRPLVDALFGIENAHRPVVAALVRFAEMRWFAADQSLQLVLGVVLASGTAMVMMVTALRERGLSPLARAAAMLVAVMTVLWLGNVRMFFHGGEALHVYPVTLSAALASLAAFAARERRSAAWMTAGALACTVATFSFGSGVAAFAALFAVALCVRVPWKAWLPALAILVMDVILYTTLLPGNDGVKGSLQFSPAVMAMTVLRVLGSPFINAAQRLELSGSSALSAGLLAGSFVAASYVAAMLHALRHRKPLSRLGALGLGVASLGVASAGLIGLSRVELMLTVPAEAFADRYLVWSTQVWGGLALFGISLARRSGSARNGVAPAIGALTAAALLSVSHRDNAGWASAVHRNNQISAVAARLQIWDPLYLPDDDASRRAHTMAAIEAFRERRWSMFIQSPPSNPLALVEPVPAAPATSLVVLGDVFDDTWGQRQVIRVSGRYAKDAPIPDKPLLIIVDESGHVHGEAILSHLPYAQRALRFNTPVARGFDGYVIAPKKDTKYRLLLIDADQQLPVTALAFTLPSQVGPQVAESHAVH